MREVNCCSCYEPLEEGERQYFSGSDVMCGSCYDELVGEGE